MSTPQLVALINALNNIRVIQTKLAATGGALTITVFGTSGSIPDERLDDSRGAIGLEFTSLVQNIRSVKRTHPFAQTYPDIHFNLKDQISRRNWLIHEYETSAPIKWNEIADSIFNDVPEIESAIIAALKAHDQLDS